MLVNLHLLKNCYRSEASLGWNGRDKIKADCGFYRGKPEMKIREVNKKIRARFPRFREIVELGYSFLLF